MLKKRIAISKIITIILKPLINVGNIIFNKKTIKILIKSFRNIFKLLQLECFSPTATPSLLRSDAPTQKSFCFHIIFNPLVISFLVI